MQMSIIVPMMMIIILSLLSGSNSGVLADDGVTVDDGKLTVVAFVPLTFEGKEVNEPGFSYLAATRMAVEHFNDRNSIVVPELSTNKKLSKDYCNITFEKVVVFDSDKDGHGAVQSLHRYVFKHGEPNAIAGPQDSIPGNDLSVSATAMKIPIVASRGNDVELVKPGQHPYFTELYPSALSDNNAVISYLIHSKRSNYVAVIYSITSEVLSRIEIFEIMSKIAGIRLRTFGYFSSADVIRSSPADSTLDTLNAFSDNNSDIPGNKTLQDAIRLVKASGYRTIVVVTSFPEIDSITHANAAAHYGMLNGEYVWIWGYGSVFSDSQDFQNVSSVVKDAMLTQDSNLAKLLRGAAYVTAIDRFHEQAGGSTDDDRFLRAWSQQDPSFVTRVNKLTQFSKTNSLPYDYFQTTQEPYFGARFMYDAIMTIGVGACLANDASNNIMNHSSSTSRIHGDMHLAGIRSANFKGASGQVLFSEMAHLPGTRVGYTASYGVLNLLPQGLDGPLYTISKILYPRNDDFNGGVNHTLRDWETIVPFVYNDGSIIPPILLRDIPEQNYLSNTVRAIGFTLLAIALILSLGSMVWTYMYRNHPVLKAAQPQFLYLLCFGSMMIASVIYVISWDESYGMDVNMLSNHCLAMPWLTCLGYIVTYGALFTKLWRVNKVLQFTRRAIHIHNVIGPFVLLFSLAVVMLIVISVKVNSTDIWIRSEINDITGETIGKCDVEGVSGYFVTNVILMVSITVHTGHIAWKTKDVDDAYSESSWIFCLILVQLEAILVALPVTIMLEDQSTDGRYIGQVLMFWVFPISSICLIMIPKVLAVYNIDCGSSKNQRGSRNGVVISGMDHHCQQQQQHDDDDHHHYHYPLPTTTATSSGRGSGYTNSHKNISGSLR